MALTRRERGLNIGGSGAVPRAGSRDPEQEGAGLLEGSGRPGVCFTLHSADLEDIASQGWDDVEVGDLIRATVQQHSALRRP
jgi:hypothetical protein